MKKEDRLTEQELLNILQGVYDRGTNESTPIDAKEVVGEIAKRLQPFVMPTPPVDEM